MGTIDIFTFKGIILQYLMVLVFFEVEDEVETISCQPVE